MYHVKRRTYVNIYYSFYGLKSRNIAMACKRAAVPSGHSGNPCIVSRISEWQEGDAPTGVPRCNNSHRKRNVRVVVPDNPASQSQLYMRLVVRKPVLGDPDQFRHKPGYAAIEDGLKLEISDLGSRGLVLSLQRIKRR